MKTALQSLLVVIAAGGLAAASLKSGRPRAGTETVRVAGAAESARPVLLEAVLADAASVPALLSGGADVDAADADGVTPLMRAATLTEPLVGLLLEHGASVRARTKVGNDALLMAARKPGNAAVVSLLLAHGAEFDGRNAGGATPLMAAVAAEDAESVRVLLDAGADVNASPDASEAGFLLGGGRTPLMWAAYRGDVELVRLLLDRGAKVNAATGIGTALHQAAWAGATDAARVLLDAGATVDARDIQWDFTPLHWAAAAERRDPSLVSLLLSRGADVKAAGGAVVDNFLGVPQTPLMLALRRGPTRIAGVLREAGAAEPVSASAVPVSDAVPAQEAPASAVMAAAADRLLETAVVSRERFTAHASRQNCISCHQQQLPFAAVSAAQRHGARLDDGDLRGVLDSLVAFDSSPFNSQPVFHPEAAISFGYSAMALSARGLPRSPATDGMVHSLLVLQAPDGRWHHNLPRPPMQSSDIAATAMAIRCLTLYPDPRRKASIDAAVNKGRRWLEAAVAETTEEKAHRVMGLAWAGGGEPAIREAATALLADQREDGGWGQLEHLPSDAYGTGLAVFALLDSGAARRDADSVRRALAFLVRTRTVDGTWRVRRRAIPFQPPMQSGFPHGADSWISSAGTSWAVLALALATDERDSATAPAASGVPEKSTSPSGQQKSPEVVVATAVDFDHDLAPVLKRSCAGCHGGDRPKGGYDVTSPERLLTPGRRGEPVFDPARPEASILLRAVRDEEPDFEMPPMGQRAKHPALSRREQDMLETWLKARALRDAREDGGAD